MKTAEGGSDARLRELVRETLSTALRRVEPLAAGLGSRRFLRLWTESAEPATLVARIEAPEDPAGRPPGLPPEPPLEPFRTLLENQGLPVPRRYGGDAAAGIDLLEDVGSTSLADAAADASRAQRRALYAEACALVPRLQRVARPDAALPAFLRRLDPSYFQYKAELFATWGLRARGRPATSAEAKAVRDAFEAVAAEAADAPARLAHRDFQSSNLYLRAGRPPGERLVMIDLQGAFLAPPEYDLVCLLRDSYVELEDDEVAAHLAATRPALPDAPDAQTCQRRFDLLTLTRKAKDYARFYCAARERKDERFLRYLPATARYLRHAAGRSAALDPRLARFAELLHELPDSPCAR